MVTSKDINNEKAQENKISHSPSLRSTHINLHNLQKDTLMEKTIDDDLSVCLIWQRVCSHLHFLHQLRTVLDGRLVVIISGRTIQKVNDQRV